MFGVPVMCQAIASLADFAAADLSALRLIITGGAPVPVGVIRTFQDHGVELAQGYGLTEASPVVSANSPDFTRIGTVGKPLPRVRVEIDRVTTGDAVNGEILVYGDNVMLGYHHREEEQRQMLMPDGGLRTGDMGELTPDGFIRITGRLREMIKVAGEMVFPAEVEHALLTHAAVFEAGVSGSKDERKGEIVRAFVVVKPNDTRWECNELSPSVR